MDRRKVEIPGTVMTSNEAIAPSPSIPARYVSAWTWLFSLPFVTACSPFGNPHPARQAGRP